ncbi:endonuclease/exonuclease/phosphatase family metal-dependent hydrolase [Rhizobium sp. SG_E_25_P2]|uniref:endonuclease/exonuclease/phosphatase family protein n=1 Tax=Rhizobium sp. SG_E_25_P2 TaxID=2879942 RepID=UPI0024736A3E|nr:endonuclease/exonuclease/phosphatase family protein [Rhizobium sp. SG_E_25_P2]MDH6266839.1 endonuclease/exonuclease/phosphatase family metal-dependent hydrolase [Rhizobium sp. SG_E_25_P2]
MKIISLNAWGGVLHRELLAYLAEADPDVLCLQEVVSTPATQRDWLVYRDGDHVLDQRANLFDDVCRTLSGHLAFFCPAARGVLWDGETEITSFWGLATFVRASVAVIGQAQSFVHKDFSAHGYGAHPRPRNAHAVRLYDPERDRTVSVAQMHGLRDLRGKMDTSERLEQARRFLALSDQASGPGDIKLLCGDFNIEPDSESLRFMQERGFTELVTRHAPEGTRTSLYNKPGRFADYMLIDQPEKVLSFDVVRDPEVSDHCPLVIEI